MIARLSLSHVPLTRLVEEGRSKMQRVYEVVTDYCFSISRVQSFTDMFGPPSRASIYNDQEIRAFFFSGHWHHRELHPSSHEDSGNMRLGTAIKVEPVHQIQTV